MVRVLTPFLFLSPLVNLLMLVIMQAGKAPGLTAVLPRGRMPVGRDLGDEG